MNFTKHIWAGANIGLLMLVAVTAGRSEPVKLQPQVITLPTNSDQCAFFDTQGNGRCDLFAMDPTGKQIYYYRHRPEGFISSPDQCLPLPPKTAWVTVGDVDPHPGRELVMSTASGIVYSRQNADGFESDQHTLIAANQVFTNADWPVFTLLNSEGSETNVSIPVFSFGHAVFYHRNNNYDWSPGTPINLEAEKSFSVSRDRWNYPWTLGANSAQTLQVEKYYRAKLALGEDENPTNAAIQKILADMRRNHDSEPPHVAQVDVNGDGLVDLVLWQVTGEFNNKTDIYIFLRGADHQLPERPTQILHCRGYPIPADPNLSSGPAPFVDLNGDGVCELVLLEFKTGLTGAGGLIETMLSRGLDWSLTVRSAHQGAFSSTPDVVVPIKALLPAEVLNTTPVSLRGDFNGDGRLDVVVRRSDTEWNIFLSTTNGHWFMPEPAISFETPAQGYLEIKDISGNGRSDIIWHEPERLTLFRSPSPPTTRAKP
jgi:hypothetical protein